MMIGGIQQYQSEVENNNFPNNNNLTKMDEKELTDLKNKIENL
jgi:ketopantoate hydroxymethyltransferase